MIGVILSAGMGTRLMPLTKDKPKPLLEINEMTLLERMIKNLMNEDIKEFIVIVGYNKEKVIEFAPTLEEKYGITIKIIENENYDTTNTSVSTYLASKYIEDNGKDDFILINGDNVVDPEIITRIAERENTSLIVDNFKDLNEESFKLIIENETFNEDNSIANGTIKEIGKGIDIPSSTGEFIGVSKVSSDDISKFNGILEDLMEEDKQNYYDFAYKTLSTISPIDFVLTNGLKWTEIDDHNDWEQAQKLINEFEN
ncbi:phosphocholine cytidylyltransferase family protein [Methanobrevibacter thaueri]|uniref:phosphocholine cytidylyltransferase family protein n=1 Tax=Methanobrevibacter thaueri TaxID=190975 RepID=UPI002583B619|nr:phosphocholine cytidylyltransferase family protein [uncultured Methanobrevibacter sp.]MBR3197171.1 phosphocholine cytidylyltransferase family protein [Methanobrevibacter sp.]MBR6928300.1 phosphocholine cytidylyltransferase family protein [Methanobrevibacter sp.]